MNNFTLETLDKTSYLLKGFNPSIIIDLSKDCINLRLPNDCKVYTTSWNTNNGEITRINSGDFKGAEVKDNYLNIDELRKDYSLAIKINNYDLFIVYLNNKLLVRVVDYNEDILLDEEKEVNVND